MSKAMEGLVELTNKTKNVHIIGPGTELKFSIDGMSAEKYMGTFNIPDGEVATAPIKTTVNGYITYNTDTRYNDILIRKNGRFVLGKLEQLNPENLIK